MRFYTKQHLYSCGIDLHARTMYVCVMDQNGEVLLHRNMRCEPRAFLRALEPYREDVVVGVECIFTWYWLADLCAREDIPFVLGHALYMKAIHGGKAKNDRIDSQKIAILLRGGMLPQAYVYPGGMRSTRDLMRRRLYLVRRRGELLAHIQNTHHQYNLPEPRARLAYRANRQGVAERFEDPSVRKTVEVDLSLIAHYDHSIGDLELFITRMAKVHDPDSFHCLILGSGGKKIGNVHLKWAFSEAAVLFLRCNPQGTKVLRRIERKHNKAKALSILAHKIGRAVYFMLARHKTFDMARFTNA